MGGESLRRLGWGHLVLISSGELWICLLLSLGGKHHLEWSLQRVRVRRVLVHSSLIRILELVLVGDEGRHLLAWHDIQWHLSIKNPWSSHHLTSSHRQPNWAQQDDHKGQYRNDHTQHLTHRPCQNLTPVRVEFGYPCKSVDYSDPQPDEVHQRGPWVVAEQQQEEEQTVDPPDCHHARVMGADVVPVPNKHAYIHADRAGDHRAEAHHDVVKYQTAPSAGHHSSQEHDEDGRQPAEFHCKEVQQDPDEVSEPVSVADVEEEGGEGLVDGPVVDMLDLSWAEVYPWDLPVAEELGLQRAQREQELRNHQTDEGDNNEEEGD